MTKYLAGDSEQYEILERAAKLADNVEGISLEIGLREGGGSHRMIAQYTNPKIHVAIDPYGSLKYQWKQDQVASWVYDNKMRNRAVSALYQLTNDSAVNFMFFNMTAEQYFAYFADGIPVFADKKATVVNKYSIINFDGVHTIENITQEVDFFVDRLAIGGIFVFDDIEGYYDHDSIEKHLGVNFELIEKGYKKASYRKIT